jgi:hypothetical protein
MIRRKRPQDQLRILELQADDPVLYGVPFYKAIASVPLWAEKREEVTWNAIKLERILTMAGVTIDYDLRREVQGPNEIWFMGKHLATQDAAQPPVTADSLNLLLETDSKPGLRITQSDEYPGLLTAHREVAYGHYALRAVAGLPTIQRASNVTTGPGATGPYAMYPNGTLMFAQAHFDVPLQLAAQQMREALTF